MQNAASEDFFFFSLLIIKTTTHRNEMNHLIVYTLPCQEKWQWLLFSWTISRLVHTHSLWHCFNWSMQSHFLKKKKKFCCKTSSSAQPGDSQWSWSLDSVVENPCVKMLTCASWNRFVTICVQWFLAMSLRHYSPWHYREKKSING